VIEFRAEVSPERRTVARAPPSRQSKAHHVKHAQNGSDPYEDSENQADPDEEFHKTHQISKKDSVREHDVAENRTIEADRRLLNVAFEIMCESGMSEGASEDLIFSEQHKEDSYTDSGADQCFGEQAVWWFGQWFLLTLLNIRPKQGKSQAKKDGEVKGGGKN
jgi:hypothetical protein